MKRWMIGALALLALGAQADTRMKPGLWEMRTVKQVMDGKDMFAEREASLKQMREAVAKLPPERRAKMEEFMKGQTGAATTAHKICISPAMAAQEGPAVPAPAQAKCDPPKTSRSGDKTSFEMSCTLGSGKILTKGDTEAHGDTITSRIDSVTTDGSKRSTMQVETQMRYVGSDCGDVKPADQLAREAQQRAASAAKPAASK